MKGYKIFNSDWTCRGKQYQVGQTHLEEGNIKLGYKGMHFCAKAIDCLSYYPLDKDCRYAQVEASDQILSNKKKSVTNCLTVVRELSIDEFTELCTGLLEDWYANGQKLSSISLVKGQPEGLFHKWTHEGLLMETVNFKSGRKEGEAKIYEYDEDNQLEKTTSLTYVDGLKEGLFETRNQSDQLIIRVNYVKGKKEGPYESWSSKGHRYSDEYYSKGILILFE